MDEKQEEKREERVLFKIMLVGDTKTGKTSLIARFLGNEFNPKIKTTIGTDFTSKSVNISPSKDKKVTATLQIWDTPGEDASLGTKFYKGSDAAGIVLRPDPDEPNTILNLEAILDYHRQVKELEPNALIYVIINKSDSFKGNRDKLTAEIRRTLKDAQIPVVFCSAKDNIGVDELFNTIATDVYKNPQRQEDSEDSSEAEVESFDAENPQYSSSSSSLWDAFENFVLDHIIWARGNLLLAAVAIITLIVLASLPIGGLPILAGLTVLGVAAIATGAAFAVWNALCLATNLIPNTNANESDGSSRDDEAGVYDFEVESLEIEEDEDKDKDKEQKQIYGHPVYHQPNNPKNTDGGQPNLNSNNQKPI